MTDYDRQMSRVELEFVARLEEKVIARIMQSDWSDEPVTEQEKHVIGMAVSATFYDLVVRRSWLKSEETRNEPRHG